MKYQKLNTHLKKFATISFFYVFGVVASTLTFGSDIFGNIKVCAAGYSEVSIFSDEQNENILKQQNKKEKEIVYDKAEFIVTLFDKNGQKVSLDEIDIKNSIGDKEIEILEDGIHIIEDLKYEKIETNPNNYQYFISKTNDQQWIYSSNVVINPNDFLNITIHQTNIQNNNLYTTSQQKENPIIIEQKKFLIDDIFSFHFKDEYIAIIKLNKIDILNKQSLLSNEEIKEQVETVNGFEEEIIEDDVNKEEIYETFSNEASDDVKILNIHNFFSIYDIFNSSEYTKPIKTDKIQEYLYNNNKANEKIELKVDTATPIVSIASNGNLMYYKDHIAKIKYANCVLVIENIIINEETINTFIDDRPINYDIEEIIGNAFCDTVTFSIEQNDMLLNMNFLYSQYEYPTKTIAMPILLQTDPQWADYSYGCSKIGPSGCGPTSFAMVLSSFYGYEYRVDKLSDEMYAVENNYDWYYLDGAGSYFSMFQRLADMYGIDTMTDKIDCSKKNLISLLEDGNVIILGIKESPYYESGHFIVVTGTENGKFYINDSFGCFKKDTLYDYSFFGTINRGYSYKYK